MTDEPENHAPPETPPESDDGVVTSAQSDPFAIPLHDNTLRNSYISSGPFEISPASLRPSQVPSDDLPPSTVIANAMGRNAAGLSLAAIVGIGAGVIVVLVGLSLLLFR